MDCIISIIRAAEEEAWSVAIPVAKVQGLIVDFCAFEYGKTDKICFRDPVSRLTVTIEANNKQPVLVLGERKIQISKVWCEAVVSMLLDVSLLGWSDTAHIDQDFSTDAGSVSVCVEVVAPE